MPTTVVALTWDLTSYFPSLDSPEFTAAVSQLSRDLEDLKAKFEAAEGGSEIVADDLLQSFNSVLEKARLIRSFVYSFVSTDSSNEVAQAAQSSLAQPMTLLSKLDTRLKDWAGKVDLTDLLEKSSEARMHEFPLRKAKELSQKLLSRDEESLLAETYDTGVGAWDRLYSNFTSQIKVNFEGASLSMSAIRTMAYDPDASVRKKGYEVELSAWKQQALPLAACINCIKGQTAKIAKRRGWDNLLDESLFAAHIDRQTLDSMMQAAREAFPVFRKYLGAKAKLLGHSGPLPFYDLFAPVGKEAPYSYEDGQRFILEKFSSYSEKLHDLAKRSFDEQWIDVEPRPGKSDGAFCMGTKNGESRILMNFKPSFNSVSTLAHELGHAYHNLCLAHRTELQRSTPMTLAETASIFCETIIKRAAIAETSGAERLAILEASLQGTCQTVVDISSRFIFESEVVRQRESRELSVTELCDTMASAQNETYGSGLDQDLNHPFMWAAKPHYYSQRAFYNFPYMFGLLFSLGIYAEYERGTSMFNEKYDAMLSETGMTPATELAGRFGIDIQSIDFWRNSLKVVERDVEEFVALVG